MSHLLICRLEMSDVGTVAQALRKLGFTAVEISEAAELRARNYNGTTNEDCVLVMRANSFGGLADFAMKRVEDGKLAAYADDMDTANYGALTKTAQRSENGSTAYNFMDNLALWYGAITAETSMVSAGMNPVTEWVNETREELRVFSEYDA